MESTTTHTNRKNPFLRQFPLKLIRSFKKSYKIDSKNLQTESLYYEEVNAPFDMEQQKKTNVYHVGYIESILFGELTSCSRDLLLYIMYRLPKNIDYIDLTYHKVMSKLQMKSKMTMSRAIKGLVDVALITKRSKSTYWVNPHYIFNGNRIDFYKEHSPENLDVVHTNFK